ncbi:hypothetical protein WJX81_005132 [Elliptochloris bilobata]|uniref:Protein DAMAGED DNA-BINDING 2 n=1 Tax=Elliptochloris bilobata TaxID=381761 RepID=A0AAW1SHY8_9CHLO
MPRFVVAEREGAEEESSSEEEQSEEEDEHEQEEEHADEQEAGDAGQAAADAERAQSNGQAGMSGAGGAGSARGKLKIQLGGAKGKLVCHVCGKSGHCAGFIGSVYHDCPNKPCYLCKKSGHTTMTCPYRIAPEHGCTPSAATSDGVLSAVRKRERDGRRREVQLEPKRWQVDAAVLRLHSRRCTCLEFHPTKDNLVLSGDKKGQVAVWDHIKVYERTVYPMHRALTNNICFFDTASALSCASASSDGLLKVFDIETGLDNVIIDLNPGGWIPGVTTEKSWNMLYGLGACGERGLLITGDTRGCLHLGDARAGKAVGRHQLHKKGNKVNSVHVHPVDCNLLLTGSNDWTARLADLRCLTSAHCEPSLGRKAGSAHPAQLAQLAHSKVVNAAYFSPVTGGKVLTTCIDNRLRVWDRLVGVDGPPDREIVHSHDFNRYLTPFRAEWDPKDPNERLIIVGRYISEDFNGSALHPVDLLDAGSGRILTQLVDANLATICPVNKPHPRLDMIVSGSSRSLYAWRPAAQEEAEGGGRARSASGALPGPSSGTPRANGGGSSAGASANYVFWDVGDDEKKKRRASSGGGAEAEGEDDGDIEGWEKKKKKGGGSKDKGKQQPRKKGGDDEGKGKEQPRNKGGDGGKGGKGKAPK